MIITENNIKNFETYIEIDVLEKFGIKILGTKKKYGCIKQKKAHDIINDFSLNNKILVSTHQTHSDNIVFIKDFSQTYFENTDGLLSSNTQAALLVKYADCLPIFIYDEDSQIFGAVHSGWQGSYQEIIIKAIKKIPNRIDLNRIHIVFGVGISCKNYEVQEDFYLKFKNKFPLSTIEQAFSRINNKIYFDNQLFNYYLLKDFGIPEKNIYRNNLCTFDGDTFHSYRRDKELSGRNGGIIYKIRKAD